MFNPFSKLLRRKKREDHPFCSAIVAAAGSSRRMEGENKLLLPLEGIPVLARTLLALDAARLVDEIVVAVREADLLTVGDLCKIYGVSKPVKIVRGGGTRLESVYAASLECREDAAFAMLVMDPMKSMVNCFQYINRQAQAYAEQEMKDNGVQRTGVYGLDVPDGLCYQWAEDYFKDENAKEDHQDDEKFTPKPYVPASAPRKTAKGKADKKPAPAEKPKAEKPKDSAGMEQLTLGVM